MVTGLEPKLAPDEKVLYRFHHGLGQIARQVLISIVLFAAWMIVGWGGFIMLFRPDDGVVALFLSHYWIEISIVLILIVWDISLQRWDPTRPNTWSEAAREASYGLPILPWFLGAMVGHLFHGGRVPEIDRDAGATLMGFFTLLVIVWSVFLYFTDGVVPTLVVAGMALAGVVVAYVIWPLDRLGDWHW